MHKKPMPTVKIRRVIFQEDGNVYGRAQAPNARQNPPITQDVVEGQ